MNSLDTFGHIIFALIFSLIAIGVCFDLYIRIYGVSRHPKPRVLLHILNFLICLPIAGLALLYWIKINHEIILANVENKIMLSRQTSCTIVESHTAFDYGHNNITFIAWYRYNSSTRYSYNGSCDKKVRCWSAVGDLISCWPVIENSTVVAYTSTPTLIDIKKYDRYKHWSIVQLMIGVVYSFVMVNVISDKIDEIDDQ